MHWQVNNKGEEFLEGYVAEDSPYPGDIDNPMNWVMVSMKLARNQTTLVLKKQKNGDSPAEPGVYNYTTEFQLTGKWVKLLGYNPFENLDVDTPGKYSVTTKQLLKFTIQTDGYDLLYIHSNFGKSVSAALSVLDNNHSVPINMLWPVQIVSNPSHKTYFVNYNINIAGKVISCLCWRRLRFISSWC